MSTPYVATPDEKLLHGRVADLTMKVARPFVWLVGRGRNTRFLSGGTCFVLRFCDGLVGVTAEHVVAALEHKRETDGPIVGLFRTTPLDLMEVTIARDTELDIATFRVTENQLEQAEATAIDCRSGNWPPPAPCQGSAISFGGYPEAIKIESHDAILRFGAFVNLTFVQAVTDREIVATYDPGRDSRIRAAPKLADLGTNLSGCSGGPVLMHVEVNGLHRWFPVGLIVAGPRGQGTGTSAEYDILRFRRIHAIQPDGSIKRNSAGWLPP